jgi:excisionase family DNA binding protein
MSSERHSRTADRQPETLLSVAEVQAWLNVSGKTVYRRIQDKTLPAVRIGRLYRVPESSVIALLNQQIDREFKTNCPESKRVKPNRSTSSYDN